MKVYNISHTDFNSAYYVQKDSDLIWNRGGEKNEWMPWVIKEYHIFPELKKKGNVAKMYIDMKWG